MPHLPLDVILVVDNAVSIDAIRAIQNGINANLAALLNGIDYRVILISRFGATEDQAICIGPPLGGNNCAARPLAGPPKNAPRFFHYDTTLNGGNILSRLLDSYRNPDRWNLAPGGWSGWLRPNAAKHFIVVSEDDSGLDAKEFVFRAFVVDPQFDVGKPTFVFHAIVGLSKALGPKAPVDPMTCGMAQNNGANYQELAILTGGQRFPVCQLGGAIFQQLSIPLIGATKLPPMLPCEADLPPPAQGLMVSSVALEFLPSMPPMAPPVKLQVVAGLAACMPSSFYMTPKSFVLCPDTCKELRKDPEGKLRATFCWNP